MNDLCFVPLGLLVVLTIVTVLGHGIWLLLALLIRALAGTTAQRTAQDEEIECPRCGRFIVAGQRRCYACGLNRDSPLAEELTDLHAAARQLERFRESGTLESAELERLFKVVEARQRLLLGQGETERPAPRPTPAATQHTERDYSRPLSARETAGEPAWQRLDRLLGTVGIGELTPAERAEALRCYEQADKADMVKLSAAAQTLLARLLDGAGMARDAVAAYRRLLRNNPSLPNFDALALEGARLAIRAQDKVAAEWLLERVLISGNLPAEQRRQAEAMLSHLRAPVEQEVLDVIPIEMEEQPARPVVVTKLESAPVRPQPVEPTRAESIPVGAVPVEARPEPLRSLTLPARQEPPARPTEPARQEPVEVPRRPRRSLAEVLAAFMEEKNILWGELIGGLLIVGCSIALVISLWKTLEEIPYFPFLVLSGITAALMAAGLYTLHHWKLESTSRGLLVIGTLLVPLDFMVMAGLVQDRYHIGLLDLVVPGSSLAVFAFLLYRAGRVLIPERGWLLPLAVLGAAASQMPIAWFQERGEPVAGWGWLLAAVPVLFQGLTVARAAVTGGLRPSARQAETSPETISTAVTSLFGFLGIATFATAVALGFLVYWSGELGPALQRLAVIIALGGIAPLVCGLWVHRLLSDPALATARTVGTLVGLSGMALMLAAVALAWPAPLPLLVLCTLNTIVFTAIAFRAELPSAHAAAIPCLALGYLTAIHWWLGHLPGAEPSGWQLLGLLFSAQSGTALAGLVALLGILAEATGRTGRRQDSTCYAIGSGALAFVSLALVTLQQPAAPVHALLIYGLYGLGCLGLNARFRRAAVSYLGIGLLVGATLWGASWAWPENVAAWAALVAGVALLMTLLGRLRVAEKVSGTLSADAVATQQQSPAAERVADTFSVAFAQPLLYSAEWTGALAFCMAVGAALVGSVAGQWLFAHVVTAAALAAMVLCRAWDRRALELTWIGSVLIFASLLLLFGWAVPDRSLTRTLLLALLSHATLVSVAGAALRLSGSLPPRGGGSGWGGASAREADGSVSPTSAPLLPTWGDLHAVLTGPLHHTALVASAAAVPLLLQPERGQMVAFAGYVLWLAAFWLAVALVERWPIVFGAFQTALAVAVGYGITAWLEEQPWVAADYPAALCDPRSLQSYGIGLAVLALAWVGLRIALPTLPTLRAMLEPGWPAVDRVLLAGLVVAQLLVAIWGITPGVNAELTPKGNAPGIVLVGTSHAYGAGAWTLLAVLAVTLILACWDRFTSNLTAGLVVLAISVPILIAGPFTPQLAVASALRWGLAITFLVCAVPVWLRGPLGTMAERLRMKVEPLAQAAVTARVLLVLGCMVPVLALTADIALLGFIGQHPAGPTSGFFHDIGWVASNVIPLVIVSLALVGHALRERSAGYAFSAGQVLNCSLMGGYALSVVLANQVLDGAQVVRILQLGTLGAALWALAWLATRRWLLAWQEDAVSPAKQMYMSVQVGLGVLGNAALLSGALLGLVGSFEPVPPRVTTAFYPSSIPGVAEAGSLLGWLALLAAGAAVVARSRQQWQTAVRRASPLNLGIAGGMGLVVIAFLAVSMARWTAPMWGYRTLMLGAALYALTWALAIAWGPFRIRASQTSSAPATDGSASASVQFRSGAPESSEIRSASTVSEPTDEPAPWTGLASVWVAVAGLLVVVLGFKAAIWHNDQIWCAGAITLASVAGAVVAVARRRDGWAFTAGLGLDLAAALVVWHFNRGTAFAWWYYLIQGVSAAGGAGALLWLAARKRLYGTLELRLSASYLLAVQILLALLGNAFLLGLAGLYLFVMPDSAPRDLVPLGEGGGWLAFLLPTAAALWYAARSTLPRQFAVVGFCGLLFGILAACTASTWDTTGQWVAFHTLTVSWATLGLVTLGLGLVALVLSRVPEAPTGGFEDESQLTARILPLTSHDSPLTRWIPEIRRWVELIGLLVVVLALRGINDPQAPYWSVGAALAVSLMTVGLALWSGRQRHVYEFGLLVDLAGLFVWLAGDTHTLAGFVSINALCLAVASAFWTGLDLGLRTETWLPQLRGRGLPFRHLAVILALTALACLVLVGVVSDLTQGGLEMAGGLTWAAWIATTGAVVLLLWDPEIRLANAGLYALGLMAIALAFNAQNLSPERYGWALALVLVAYVGLTSWLAWAAPRLTPLWQRLHLPASRGRDLASRERDLASRERERPEGTAAQPDTAAPAWLSPAQLTVSAIVILLSVWISLTFAGLGQRLAGPIAVVALLPAGVLLTSRFSGWRAEVFRYATLVLGVVVIAELGWAILGRDVPVLWLHRTIMLMTGLAVIAAVYAIGLGKISETWGAAARRVGPVLMVLAAALLLVVIAMEAFAYQSEIRGAPVEPWAVAVVALGLVGLIATGIRYALAPGADPFQMSERGRMAYVYIGEVLVVLLGVHLRLTLPFLFRGLLAPYYALIVMTLAFLGVGLSELFQRRGLRVLAEPLQRTGLFLPVLPLIVFWLRTPDMHVVAERAPELGQALTAVQQHATRYDHFAWLWFGAAALYGFVALTRKSFRFALIAALTGNFGLWALFYHCGWTFVGSPQLWLIPLALILLVAEHLNRDRLAAAQAAALRYLALGLIYLSSTADMFLTGLSTSWWPALLLMALSVAGVLIGMLLRVRAYLYLGVTFLFLTVFAMIWNAAVDQHRVWVWWASGICLGALILAVFAVFEKRRNDVLNVVEQIKKWH
jgi:hypothetical protein